jgi:hypothetical protein
MDLVQALQDYSPNERQDKLNVLEHILIQVAVLVGQS